jgi:hypothetical protein
MPVRARRCNVDLKEVRLERRRVLSLKSYKNVGGPVIRYIVVFWGEEYVVV